MEALQALLKAIPSELIIVDTKGADSDGSIDIVREYMDKIYPFVWCNDFANGSYSMGILGRMVRRTEQTRFVGAVHEHFNIVFEPYKVFSCFVHHYGYAFQNEEEKKKHQERNVTLLKKELARQGMTPRLCAQMTQELFSCKDTRDAGYHFCIQSIKELQQKNLLADACSQWL